MITEGWGSLQGLQGGSVPEEPSHDSSSNAQCLTSMYAGEGIADGGVPPLPDVSSLPTGLLDIIHSTVWEVARLFGFQTFNPAATKGGKAGVEHGAAPSWTPATAFVAGDHIASLLNDAMLRRTQAEVERSSALALPAPGQAEDASLRRSDVSWQQHLTFAQCIHDLHSNIFHAYETGWCRLVHLHPLPKTLDGQRRQLHAASPDACHMLLCELALYFLIWTEAANTRHLPEGMWFLYWCCSHTSAFVELCCCSRDEALGPSLALGRLQEPRASLRDWRVQCRNLCQDEISASQKAAGHKADKRLPAACFPPGWQQQAGQGLHDTATAIAAHVAEAGTVPSPAFPLVTELALNGDGGFWCDHIVTPLFLLLAQEMDALSEEDHCHRLGYDDVNESLSSRNIVHATLAQFGVTKEQLKQRSVNDAFTAIAVWIGSPRSMAPLGGTFSPAIRNTFLVDALAAANGASKVPVDGATLTIPAAAPAGANGDGVSTWFVAKRATAFWSVQVARKTFNERRTWWAVYRAYHRVFALNLTAFHLMMAQSLVPQDWRVLSSAILTHATLTALERYANSLISRETTSAAMRKDKAKYGTKWSWRPKKASVGDLESALALPADHRALRLMRKHSKVEGAPVWGIFGFLEWQILAAGMIALYVCQYVAPDYWSPVVTRDQLQYAWAWTTVGYVGAVVVHFILTTRPGYCISLSNTLYLPSIFTASSCRPAPTCWVAGSLSVGFGSWLRQVLTWTAIWIFKWAFEFFAVSKPLAAEIHQLLQFDNCSPDLDLAEGARCININWLLVVMTVAPFVCLVLVDGMIFYHAYLTLTCVLAWLLQLNNAALPEWDECVGEFHRAPARWWAKCMSAWNRKTALEHSSRRFGIEKPALKTQRQAPGGGTLSRAVKGAAADPKNAAQWDAFSQAWDALVADLREGDLLNDTEASNCSFVRLHNTGSGWSDWSEAALHVGPVVMPAFFYAGQVQRVIDTGSLNGVQGVVLRQLCSLALLLAVELGLMTGEQASACQAVNFLARPAGAAHLEARTRTVASTKQLVQALRGVVRGEAAPKQAVKAFADALKLVMQGLEVECRAASRMALDDTSSLDKLEAGSLAFSRILTVLQELQAAAKQTDVMAACLEPLAPGPGCSPLACQLVHVLLSMLTTTAQAACPRSSEARRVMSAFLNSLSLDTLAAAPALLEMRSLTVLTPLYSEDVTYCLDGKEAIQQLGLADKIAGGGSTLSDLMTAPGTTGAAGEQQGVSLLTYLKGVHPTEWDNFRERVARLARQAGAASLPGTRPGSGSHAVAVAAPAGSGAVLPVGTHWGAINEHDFVAGGRLAPWALELQLWASYRAQVLARTVRGMMCCERALHVLGELEYPQPVGMPRDKYEEWIQGLAESKFTYLVAAQAYGKQRASSDARDRWLAHCIEVLLTRHSAMRVAYLDSPPAGPVKKGGASVMIKGRFIRGARAGPGSSLTGGLQSMPSEGVAAAAAGEAVEEIYRVRLPLNPYSGRSIVVGEGKPENQNHALIFAFGESLQTIDMNQDGCVAEALKMRNLLAELSPVSCGTATPASKATYTANQLAILAAQPRNNNKDADSDAAPLRYSYRAPNQQHQTRKSSPGGPAVKADAGRVMVAVNAYSASNSQEGPVVRHHLPEDLPLMQQARGSRQPPPPPSAPPPPPLAPPPPAATCPGYPTRGPGAAEEPGGTSGRRKQAVPLTSSQELQRLRTARSSFIPTAICGFKEWIFSYKAGALASFAAATEYAFATVIQRDMAKGNVRLHYGHPDVFDKLHCMSRGGLSKATRGLHVSEDVMGGLNHVLRGGGVKYTEAISCGKGRDMGFTSILAFETKISSGNGEVLLTRDMARLAPRLDVFRLLHFYHSGLGYFITARLLMLGIYCQALAMAVVSLAGYGLVNSNLQLLIQIGLVSSLPYLAQLIMETGIINAIVVFFQQLIAGSIAFSIFRMQTTAYYFAADVLYGGASYIQTGRGFAYRPLSFVQLYASYGRSHMYLGFELGLLAVVVAVSGSAGANYGALMWGIWLVAASLLAAPLWFNPLSFNMEHVKQDWRLWRLWLKGEVDPDTQASWYTFNRRQLQKVRDDAGQQDRHWLSCLIGIAFNCIPHAVLAFVAATKLTELSSVFLLLTVFLWAILGALTYLRSSLLDSRRFKLWTRIRTLVIAIAIALPIAFIVVCSRLPWHMKGAPLFFLTLYVHLSIVLMLHAAFTPLCKGLSTAGALIDSGFWVLDCVSGSLLLSVVALLSIGGLLEKLQAVLLFSRAFAKSIKDGRMARSLAQLMPSGKDKETGSTQQDNNAITRQLREAAVAVTAQSPGPSTGTNFKRSAMGVMKSIGTTRLMGLLKGSAAGGTMTGASGTHQLISPRPSLKDAVELEKGSKGLPK